MGERNIAGSTEPLRSAGAAYRYANTSDRRANQNSYSYPDSISVNYVSAGFYDNSYPNAHGNSCTFRPC